MGANTHWPSDFSELKKLDDILQCPICYEFIDTCMITSCSHNFCSLCIRKYLQFKTQCPTCFEETHGSELRKNRLLDDIITIYVKLRDRLAFTLRLVTMTQSVKTESKVNGGIDSPSISPAKEKTGKSIKKETRTPKNVKNRKSVVQKLFSEKKTSPENEEVKPIVVDGVTIPSMFQPHKSPKKCTAKKPEDMSECPVCSVDVPTKNLNLHLDSCLAASDPDSSRLKRKPEKRDPIPKRVYTMMKEKEIKKYLKDYGLSTGGDKKAMISRISRYVVLYNAECDKEYPRPVSELVKQVERDEKDEKTTSSNPLFQAARPPTIPPEKKKDPETIEKLNKEYLDLNKENFKKLIEAMKQRDGKNIKPLKPLNRIESDDENEIKPAPLLDQPSTSKQNNDMETNSVYSQETIVDSDSDPDMIDKTPVKVEVDVHEQKRIDWDKTQVKEDDECEIVEEPDKNETIVTIEEESDSYESVFNTSTKSDLPKTPSNKLSMSARKNQKSTKKVTPDKSPSSSKLCDRLDEIFDEAEDDGTAKTKLTNGTCHNISMEDDDDLDEEEVEDEEEEEDEDSDDEDDDEVCSLKTPLRKLRGSPQVSPMKTRSAKRKSQTRSDEEKSAGKTSTSRRKRVKPSVSPDSRSMSPEF